MKFKFKFSLRWSHRIRDEKSKRKENDFDVDASWIRNSFIVVLRNLLRTNQVDVKFKARNCARQSYFCYITRARVLLSVTDLNLQKISEKRSGFWDFWRCCSDIIQNVEVMSWTDLCRPTFIGVRMTEFVNRNSFFLKKVLQRLC